MALNERHLYCLQSTQLCTGQSEHGACQISFHPSDPDLLCTVGDGGLCLWRVDKHADQGLLQQISVQMPGES